MKLMLPRVLPALLLIGAPLAATAGPTSKPTTAQAGRSIEVCFVLDTTGSMGGLIDGAKRKIWSIANDVIATKPTPARVRIALVAYRDRGDTYITKVFDLTDDIDTVYKNLQTFQADGGGDTPESVNQALADAVAKVGWSKPDVDATRLLFLVGDAPPHMDYTDDVKYPVTLEQAVRRNLIVNAVQCGDAADTAVVWRDVARRCEGSYLHVGQTGDMAAAPATPVDAEIAALNHDVGKTLVPFGTGGHAFAADAAAAQSAKQAASESAPTAVAASRLAYNAASGKAVQGDDELIDAIAEHRATLADLKDDQLPPDLRALSPADRAARVKQLAADRSALQAKIADANRRRDDYLAQAKRNAAVAGHGDAFDEQVAKVIADEAARRGK